MLSLTHPHSVTRPACAAQLPPDADTPAGERCKTAWVPGKVEFPADASPPVRVVAVSTGDGHAVAVDDAGRAWGWGVFVETCGQARRRPPHTFPLTSTDRPHSVARFRTHAHARATRAPPPPQLAFSPAAAVQATPALMHSPGGADGRRAVAVASGDDHAVLLLRDGTALTAGCAQKGRLGRFAMAAADPAVGEFRGAGAAREALLADRLLFAPVPGLPPLRAVAAGGFATFFVARDGEGGGGGGVYACGLNQCGQLGFPPPPSDPAEGAPAGAGAAALTAAREARDAGRAVYAPRRVSQLDGKSVVALFPGQHHTLALTASGALLSAGRADGGRLGRAAAAAGVQAGDGLHEFAPVDGLDAEGGCDPARRAVAASAGVATSACVRGDGAMCAWGYGETAMLGKGDEDEADEAAPRAMAPTRRFPGTGGLAVSLGGQHALWVARAPPGLAGEERDEKRRRQQ